MDVTVRQHFVYRKYLSPWTDECSTEGKIWSKTKQKTFNPNLKKIALEKYFYKIEELNEEEIFILRSLSGNNAFYKKLNEGWINNIKTIFTLINHLKKEMVEFPEKEVEDLLTQMGEDLQSSYEKEGIELLEYLKNEDKGFLQDIEKSMSFYSYLNMQYFRTKKMKNVILSALNDAIIRFPEAGFEQASGEKIAKVLPLIFTTSVSLSLLNQDKKHQIHFLKSNGKKFITSDQPIINICEEIDDKNVPNTLDFYYPLSPNIAIIFSNSDGYRDVLLNDEEVDFYNKKIAENAEQFIFAKYEEDLFDYELNN